MTVLPSYRNQQKTTPTTPPDHRRSVGNYIRLKPNVERALSLTPFTRDCLFRCVPAAHRSLCSSVGEFFRGGCPEIGKRLFLDRLRLCSDTIRPRTRQFVYGERGLITGCSFQKWDAGVHVEWNIVLLSWRSVPRESFKNGNNMLWKSCSSFV